MPYGSNAVKLNPKDEHTIHPEVILKRRIKKNYDKK